MNARRGLLFGLIATVTVVVIVALATQIPRVLRNGGYMLDVTDFHLAPGPRNDTAQLRMRLQWRRRGSALPDSTATIATVRDTVLAFEVPASEATDRVIRVDTHAKIVDLMAFRALAAARHRTPLRLETTPIKLGIGAKSNSSDAERNSDTQLKVRFVIDPAVDISRA